MTTTELIKLLAKRLDMSQKLTRQALKEVLHVLSNRLIKGETAVMPGLGKLQVQTTKDRYGHIPGKGKCFIPARQRVSFHQDKTIKQAFALLDKSEEILQAPQTETPTNQKVLH